MNEFPWNLEGYDCLGWVAAMLKKYPVLWCVEWENTNGVRGKLLIRCREDEDLLRPAIFSKRKAAHKFAQEISAQLSEDDGVSVCKFTRK